MFLRPRSFGSIKAFLLLVHGFMRLHSSVAGNMPYALGLALLRIVGSMVISAWKTTSWRHIGIFVVVLVAILWALCLL